MTKSFCAAVYFADSYCSWQRGLNENPNGLLRHYRPKKTVFKKVSAREVRKVIRQLNKRTKKS
jgi:IS30 family transposase